MKRATTAPETDLWKRILKIERRIEETMTEEPTPGYLENMFGSFDRGDLTSELLALYAQLHEQAPDDGDVKYRHAGAMMRASRFDDARRLYTEVMGSNTSAHLMLAMLELKCGDRAAAETMLAGYNQRCVAEGMPFMQSNMEKIALRSAG